MGKNIVKEKSFKLAVAIVELYKYLKEEKKESVMSRQLLRSGTAVGALIREAEHAESKKDFIHKMSIALKECNESEYWLDLLKHTGFLNSAEYELIQAQNREVLRLLIAIVKSSKAN